MILKGLIFVLEIVGLAIVVFIAYSLLKKYVFSKFKVSKWIIIGLVVLVFVVPLIITQAMGLKMNSIFSTIQAGVFVVLFLWLMDTMGWGPKPVPVKSNLKNKTKYATTTVIKAKAKPNRLKNTDMEVIEIQDAKKKKKK